MQKWASHTHSQQYPPAASTPNTKGKIPLHYAAREGRLAMVDFFLTAAPETAEIASDKHKLALHFAAGDGHLSVVERLLQASPSSAARVSAKGKLALHFCARWGHRAIAERLLAYYPPAVSTVDWEGSLPLHDAAREGQVEMARLLMERYPEGLQVQNLRSEVPLFPAVRSGSKALVELLLDAWPHGGRSVLRHVSEDDRVAAWPDDMLDLLLKGAVDYKTARSKSPVLDDDKDRSRKRKRHPGFLPLHAGWHIHAAVDVLRVLHRAHAATALQVDEHGRTALHIACEDARPSVADLIGELIDPVSSATKDAAGRWPLEIALEHGLSSSVVDRLVEAYPRAAVEDWQGQWPVVVAACTVNAEESIVYRLLRADPSVLQRLSL